MKKRLLEYFLLAFLIPSWLWAQGRGPAIVESPSNPYVQGASQLTDEEIEERKNLAYVVGGSGVLLTVFARGLSNKSLIKSYNKSWAKVASTLNTLGNLSTQYEGVLNSGEAYNSCQPTLELIEASQKKLRGSKIFKNHQKVMDRLKARGFEPTNSIYEQYSASDPIEFVNWNLPVNKKAVKGPFIKRTISGVLATAGVLLIVFEGNVLAMSFGMDLYPDQEKIYTDLKNNMGLLADHQTWEKLKSELKRAFEQKKTLDNSETQNSEDGEKPNDLFEIDEAFKRPEKTP